MALSFFWRGIPVLAAVKSAKRDASWEGQSCKSFTQNLDYSRNLKNALVRVCSICQICKYIFISYLSIDLSLSHRFVGVIAGWIFVNLCRPWHPRNFVARWANFGASARKPMAFCAGNVVGKYGFKTFQAPWKQWKCVSCVWPDVSAISSNFDPDCHTYREKSYDGFSKWMVEIIENQMIFVWAPPSFEKLPNEVFLILSFNSWFWMPQLHRTTPPHSKLSHAGKAGCGMRQLTMSLDSLGGSCPAREYPLKTDLQHLTTNWKWSYLVGPWMNFR